MLQPELAEKLSKDKGEFIGSCGATEQGKGLAGPGVSETRSKVSTKAVEGIGD